MSKGMKVVAGNLVTNNLMLNALGEIDVNIRKVLRQLHRELLQNCPAMQTKKVVKGKIIKTPVNHYARLKDIVKQGGDLDACYKYCKNITDRYNAAVKAYKSAGSQSINLKSVK